MLAPWLDHSNTTLESNVIHDLHSFVFKDMMPSLLISLFVVGVKRFCFGSGGIG